MPLPYSMERELVALVGPTLYEYDYDYNSTILLQIDCFNYFNRYIIQKKIQITVSSTSWPHHAVASGCATVCYMLLIQYTSRSPQCIVKFLTQFYLTIGCY